MEEEWRADRTALRYLLKLHPEWSNRELAQTVQRSISWVKKWKRRLAQVDPSTGDVLAGRSRARHTPPPRIASVVVERILAIRDEPPDGLRRTPGPKTIRYFLHRDPDPSLVGVHLPTSTRTIWRILREQGRIAQRAERHLATPELPPPLTQLHLDFKDASTVPGDPEGKKQHQVEILNTVDRGTSIPLTPLIRSDFVAETTLRATAALFQEWGLPERVVFDRDPRFVGSAGMGDFPTAFVRFLWCLGVTPMILPPHRPDMNGVVERFHRSYTEECLARDKPRTLEQVVEVTQAYWHHYLYERPHQGRACGNRPPRVAFPQLPERPPVPVRVDPDRWIQAYHGRQFVRKVRADTSILLDDLPYYVSRELIGQLITVQVEAPTKELVALAAGREVDRWFIKGTGHAPMLFDAYVEWIAAQARTERMRASPTRHLLQLALPW